MWVICVMWVIVIVSVSRMDHTKTTPDSLQLGCPWSADQYVGIHPGVYRSGLYTGEYLGVHGSLSRMTTNVPDVLKSSMSIIIDTTVENIYRHSLCYIYSLYKLRSCRHILYRSQLLLDRRTHPLSAQGSDRKYL